tara:strand:- start:82 stop:534 length:453 start_codon:yes stop_codon:yes gene_type:complete
MIKDTQCEKKIETILDCIRKGDDLIWNYYELFQRSDITDELVKYCIKYGQEYYFVPEDAWFILTENKNFPLKFLGKLIRMLEEDGFNIKKILNWEKLSSHKDLDRKYIKNHMNLPWDLELVKKFFTKNSKRYARLVELHESNLVYYLDND